MRRWGMGGLAYVVMAAGLFLIPSLVVRSWSSGSPGASETEGMEVDRLLDRVVDVEGWASEGFAGLAEELASLPAAPTWEGVRLAMERRGCSDLRYALKIHCLRGDGGTEVRMLLRRPYDEPQHAEEFLRYLRGGPDAAVWQGAGAPPWKADPRPDPEQ